MSLSQTNRDDIIANSYSLITSNGSVVDILDAVNSSIVGLPPSTLNTIEKLSSAISNDPNYFSTMQTAINAKASTTTLTSTVETLNTSIGGKQNKFLTTSTIPANTGRVFDVDSTKFRAINVASPLSITTPNFDYLTISCDSYTKAQTDTKISDLVGAAPALLNTLVELSAALGNDQNYATTITNALAAKAPIDGPTFTGTVSGITKAMVGLANAENTTDLAKPVSTLTTAQLNLKAPIAGPTFTGTVGGITKAMVGLANVENTTDLAKVVSTLTTTQLNLKAPIASPIFTGDLIIMETAVPGQIMHAFRQSGLSNIRTELQVSGDIASTGTVWSQNEACLTGIQAYTKAQVNTALNLKAPLATPNFTGTATFNNVAIANQLLVGIVDVMSTLNNKAPNHSPSFLGTVTCESDTTIGGALTVSGARLNVASNITNW